MAWSNPRSGTYTLTRQEALDERNRLTDGKDIEWYAAWVAGEKAATDHFEAVTRACGALPEAGGRQRGPDGREVKPGSPNWKTGDSQ